jgi:hypothetical protein
MKGSEVIRDKDWPGIVRQIKGSDRPEVEKLAYAFGWITGRILEHARYEIEVANALQDEEALVKEQLKLSIMKHARGIFQECHKLATGRKAWDE